MDSLVREGGEREEEKIGIVEEGTRAEFYTTCKFMAEGKRDVRSRGNRDISMHKHRYRRANDGIRGRSRAVSRFDT